MKIAGPMCCGQDSIWVDMGPTLQYYYCKECKNEVKDKPIKDPSAERISLKEWEKELDSMLESFGKGAHKFGSDPDDGPPPDTFMKTGFPRLAKNGELDDEFTEESIELDEEDNLEAPYITDPTCYEGAD